jgi:hypothetical protein
MKLPGMTYLNIIDSPISLVPIIGEGVIMNFSSEGLRYSYCLITAARVYDMDVI